MVVNGVGSKEAWVTFALNDEDVGKALILLQSLRISYTNRKVVLLLATKQVSASLWARLGTIFDEVHDLPDPQVLSAATHAASLVQFKRVFFLVPDSIVLNNADLVFNKSGVRLACCGNGNVAALLLTPSFELGRKLAKLESEGETCKSLLDGQDRFMELLQPSKLEDEYCFPLWKQGISQYDILQLNPRIVLMTSSLGHVKVEENITPFQHATTEYWSELNRLIKSSASGDINIEPPLQNEPIAIIGMSVRMPQSNNMSEFWDIFKDGRCAITHIPENHWSRCYPNEIPPETQAGFLNCPIDEFDPKFFGVSPSEAMWMDPQCRLLLEVVWETLEDAGIPATKLQGSDTGVFAGAFVQGYLELIKKSGENDWYRSYMGNGFGNLSARIAFFLETVGPAISTESGCSTFAVELGLAIKALRSGQCGMAFAAAANVFLADQTLPHVFSPDYRCKVFDAGANGYVKAEGVGALLLKRVSDAIRDGDKIHGLIRGFSESQDGCSKSMGTPTVASEAAAMSAALIDATTAPENVLLIEAHGTGTSVGDPMEVAAIHSVYSTPNRGAPLILTAGKANVGHTESVGGLVGIVKTLLMMKHQMIPQQIGITTLNPTLTPFLNRIPATIVTASSGQKWMRTNPSTPLLAGVSAFGITGTNTHAILQEWSPDLRPRSLQVMSKVSSMLTIPPPPNGILTLSAKSQESLSSLVQEYTTLLESVSTLTAFQEIAYKSNLNRAELPLRLAIPAPNASTALRKLEHSDCQTRQIPSNTSLRPKIVFLFPGHNCQHTGMGRTFYETYPVFRSAIDSCDNLLNSQFGIQLKNIMWGTDSTLMNTSAFAQTAIFAVEYALYQLLFSWGITPDYVLGHSLGEFAAVTAAGIFSLEDTISFIGPRSTLVNELPPGKMLAMNVDKTKAEQLRDEYLSKFNSNSWLDVACVNSPTQTVLSGPPDTIEGFAAYVKQHLASDGLKATVLNVTTAFHSRGMDCTSETYVKLASSLTYSPIKPGISYVSACKGKILKTVMEPIYWSEHNRSAVQFVDAMQSIWASTAEEEELIFVEVGPHPLLSALVHANPPPEGSPCPKFTCLPTMRRGNKGEGEDVGALYSTLCARWVAGVGIKWESFHSCQTIPQTSALALPFYPWIRKPVWYMAKGNGKSLSKSMKMNLLRRGSLKDNTHLLLGQRVALQPHQNEESTEIQAYSGIIRLDEHAYLLDHKIGDWVLFPGAGFLEMSIAAAGGNEKLPVILEDFGVKIALHLDEEDEDNEDTGVEMFTSIKDDDVDGHVVSIYARKCCDGTEPTWKLHSTARIAPNPTSFSTSSIEQLSSIQSRFASSSTSIEEDISSTYARMIELGYNHGPHFRPITTLIRDKDEILLRICLPSKDCYQMCLHPILLDGMSQGVFLLDLPTVSQLMVPTGIQHLALLERVPYGKEDSVWFHCSAGGKSVLYSKEGAILASMSGLGWAKTTSDRIGQSLGLLGHNNSSLLPPLYTQKWLLSPKNKDVKILPNGKNNLWMIFGDVASCEVTKLCVKELEKEGRRVQLIGRGHTEGFYTLGAETENSPFTWRDLWSKLDQDVGQAEGILFLWGLNPTKAWKGGMEMEQKWVETSISLAEETLHLFQAIMSKNFAPGLRVVGVTRGQTSAGNMDGIVSPYAAQLSGLFRTFMSENPGMLVSHVDLEDHGPNITTEAECVHIMGDMLAEAEDDREGLIAYRSGCKYHARLSPTKITPLYPNLTIPPTRFHALLPTSRRIPDLRFTPMSAPSRKLSPQEIEVEVVAGSLNFRDIFALLKPSAEFEAMHSFGVDFAGRVTAIGSSVTSRKVGDSVIGMNYSKTSPPMPSHLTLPAAHTAALPSWMSYEDGAALPTVWLTAFHCLITVGKLKAGETILIHSASGGVGLAAITIALQAGAKVIATAGSVRKRDYLREVMRVENVFNSRDLSFGPEVLRVTGGVGVHVVLNSLTGAGFKETTLECTLKGGRWVEMGKLNIWTINDVASLRPDVSYSIEDLGSQSDEKYTTLFKELETGLIKRSVQPLPTTRFPLSQTHSALTYLQKAKHIGKVVLSFPSTASYNNSTSVDKFSRFPSRSTYLVTGGFGGIGLEVGKWVLSNGASTVILAGRSAPSKTVQAELDSINAGREAGTGILVHLGDIGDWASCNKLISWIKNELPYPLRGIMHAAGVLADAILPNQTPASFITTQHPKVRGGWNLHLLTRSIPTMDHFVMFSSVVALMGFPGQSNHALANSFLDGLTLHRLSLGLPATTINWGQWGEVGIAAGKVVNLVAPFSTKQGLDALWAAISPPGVGQLCPNVFRKGAGNSPGLSQWWTIFLQQAIGSSISVGDGKRNKNKGESVKKDVNTGSFLTEIDSLPPTEDISVVYKIAIKHITKMIQHVLQVDDEIRPQDNLAELGLDSLMRIEMRNGLQRLLGNRVAISTTQLEDCNTLHSTTELVLKLIKPQVDTNSKTA